MARIIVYELKNGKEEVFEIDFVEMEQHERAAAEMEVSSRDTLVKDYRLEWVEVHV